MPCRFFFVSLVGFNAFFFVGQLFPHEGAEPGIVDLGLLSAGKVHTFRFGLHNHNPVPIELKAVGSDTSAIRPQILGIFKGNTTAFKTSYLYGNITDAVSSDF